ncbi:uncharacterized protein EI97DRAFT_436127 [Westerdykella ornata]|uniref:RING-type domain-containing protein n=1 Tax=Westerdykella ornata TaxID=318751 RepID=A0A6A6JA70_WESOR|nr:uncharacterized protein EI97DRAFT_436127 [Westerdykella ornata]KAF2273481.1 hypothetical protein EI97DRAFT_436127 [Westerdykella ornata]
MTASRIDIFTVRFPDPSSPSFNDDQRWITLPTNVSFRYPITDNIQTLSSKNAGYDASGILYVPELRSDECKKSEEAYVPANATRSRNLPSSNPGIPLIALAPWFSPTCMKEYLESVRKDSVRVLFVFQPGTDRAMPPPMADASWGLGDGGAWKSANDFPTYAINAASGSVILAQMTLYSGNLSEVPHGKDLSSALDSTDYVRLWARVETDAVNRLPSLWVFLIIVLAILMTIIAATSLTMHCVQRRRREELRRRVINGEINLEAVGVKRLTVPREFLEKLPSYTYSAPAHDSENTMPQLPPSVLLASSTGPDSQPTAGARPWMRSSSAPSLSRADGQSPAFSQPSCPICLDDFESNETQVRELPCRHIFHPDCIDPYLLNNSSLCPICKESVMPSGYCPTRITNVMVRRERMLRRAGNRRPSGPASSLGPLSSPIHLGLLGSRIGGVISGRRVFSAPDHRRARSDEEMAISNAAPLSTDAAPGTATSSGATPLSARSDPGCGEIDHEERRERARERALTLLGNRHVPSGDEDEEASGPWWRRGLRKVFPGFR